jgi:GT2 family glycosyltransferase
VFEARLAAVCDSLHSDLRGEVLVAGSRLSDRARETIIRSQSENVSVRVLDASEREVALVAKCEAIVFIGNDEMPLPDWLPVLLRSLRRYPDAAIVGGRVLGWDGRLCEAGGVLAGDGTLQFLGAGHVRPDSPAYSFVREVDWCSRSLLATWRAVFEEHGGFDLTYRSSRLQDADYCLRVRQAGHRVYYQPESVVVRLSRRDAAREEGPNRLESGERLSPSRSARLAL